MTIAALIPAAGLSLRMGRPKLILPVGGIPLISRVVDALRKGGAGRVIVITPPDGSPGASELIEAAQREGAEIVVAPSPPSDMRASIELGLIRLGEGPEPTSVLLTPGDSPGLDSRSVARVVGRATETPGRIVIPRHDGRRGHPLLLPWPLACLITRLPADLGVNALMTSHADLVEFVETDDPGILDDLDTPEDYRRWSG
ncbi:nucleotidyltransferase family protein (plasmid) [Tundrisphaera lichenicola]|uniref:nucleotidyltransferase family protein n=1 Tax=Tundrisphaera lichenicola TaxID=2029860 RepID=UPI003EBF95FC